MCVTGSASCSSVGSHRLISTLHWIRITSLFSLCHSLSSSLSLSPIVGMLSFCLICNRMIQQWERRRWISRKWSHASFCRKMFVERRTYSSFFVLQLETKTLHVLVKTGSVSCTACVKINKSEERCSSLISRFYCLWCKRCLNRWRSSLVKGSNGGVWRTSWSGLSKASR